MRDSVFHGGSRRNDRFYIFAEKVGSRGEAEWKIVLFAGAAAAFAW
jgi:hypothetical protein